MILESEGRGGNDTVEGRLRNGHEYIEDLYSEMRVIAAARLSRERANHTLQPTTLVHEAVLRLIRSDMSFEDESHFLAAAARAVRRVLVDHARARKAKKRSGRWHRVTLDIQLIPASARGVDTLVIDEAMSRLSSIHGRPGRVAELRFFGDLTLEQTACVLKVSRKTVTEDWAFARAWLLRELSETEESSDSDIG